MPLINSKNPDFSSFIALLAKLLVLFALGSVALWASSRIQLKILTSFLYDLRCELFTKLETLPIKYYDKHPHGDVMSRFTNDIDTLREMFSSAFPQMMSSSVMILAVFVMMMVLSPILAGIEVATLALMMIFSSKITKKSALAFKKQQENIGRLNGFTEEIIEGMKVVKVFNHENESEKDFEVLNKNLQMAATEANAYSNVLGPIMNNFSHVQFALVAIVGSFFVISGRLDLGSVASFLQYTRSFSQPVTMISQLFNSILNALAGAERIFNTIDETAEIDAGHIQLVNAYDAKINGTEKLVQSFAYTGQWAWKNIADNHLEHLRGDILFDGVTFGYKANKTILHDIHIHAKSGEKIALVGSTGSGKTTIINLLTRFYDVPEENGTIFYDNFPINQIKKDDLRRSLGIVLQDTHLFSGTIYDNIKYGNLEATKKQVLDAAKLSNAHLFISHLKDGYDTYITGDGENLSQGQRQLLAIARAAVANPPVLILDEATSSIDTRTESLVQSGMDALMKGRTVFVIAHRLSTVQNADEIIVLEKGRVLERGNHTELMEKQGRYYELWTGRTVSSI